MKIRISKKKPVNEFLGGLFSFGSTASKTKPLGSGTANRPMNLNKMFSTLKDLDSQVGKQKLQSLGLSLEDLYNTINNATKIFKSDDKTTTGKGGVQAFGMSKIQNAINLMQQDYQDVIEKVKSKKLTAEEGNKVITGISRIAGFIHDYTPALMEENDDKLNEAFGMQKRAIYKFLQSLKGVDDQGNPVEKIADPSVTAQAAMKATPPAPPADSGEEKTTSDDAAAQAAMNDEPDNQDKAVKYSASNRTGTGPYYEVVRKTKGYPEDISKNDFMNIISAMGGTNILAEQMDLNNIATASKVPLEKVKKLVDFMQKNDLLKNIGQAATSQQTKELKSYSALNKDLGSFFDQIKAELPNNISTPTALVNILRHLDANIENVLAENEQLTLDVIAKKSGFNVNDVKQTIDVLLKYKLLKPEIVQLLQQKSQDLSAGAEKITAAYSQKQTNEPVDVTNESKKLKEHLINHKKEEIFTDKDAKRFKLLAGLL